MSLEANNPTENTFIDYHNSDIKTPWSSIGLITAKRTYCRRLDEENEGGPKEDWKDVCNRVVNAARDQLKVPFEEGEDQYLFDIIYQLKGSVAGRFLWQLGTKTVDKLGLASLQNCAFVAVNEPIRPFTWTMDMLMLGCGVGFSIQKEDVYKLPKVREDFVKPVRQDNASADFIIPDTREGWVELLERVLKSAFIKKEKVGFTFSSQLIRGKGTLIKGFGGVASGPEELCSGINQISKIIEARAGKQLRPIDCLDIMNIIAEIVVSGNVRRSAMIAIGDPDDFQYLKAKNWTSGNIPNWRKNSNNSVVCNDINNLPDEFWKNFNGSGEPYGLINLKLARSCGRLGDTQYKDKEIQGFNPCGEQGLANFENCCLAETFLPNINSEEELFNVVKTLYKVNKHSLMLNCHNKETEDIVHKNMRMGIGITGYLQATEEQKSWLPKVYEKLRAFDVEYSKKHGMPISIKLTTVKPSGTLSLLPGVTPGWHPGFAQYMIRRLRIASNNPLVQVIKEHGYHVEYQKEFDGSCNYDTVVASFPFSYPEGTVLAKDLKAVDQMKVIERLQSDWSDNAVSCTVYYTKEEIPEIQEYLKKHYNKGIKTISFLLHSGHGFDQAPFEEITEDEFKKLTKKTRLIESIDDGGDMDTDAECTNGVCPIR